MKRFLTAACVAAFMAGCNGDIFTEVAPLPERVDVVVEPDGGEWATAFPHEGLTAIEVECDPEIKVALNYYNREEMPTDASCPASELGSIVVDNPVRFFSIGFYGKMMSMRSSYNAGDSIAIGLRLEYESGVTKKVNFKITAGVPLETVSSAYTGELMIDHDIRTTTHRTSFANNSNIRQQMTVAPFSSAQCSVELTSPQEWTDGLKIDVPVIYHNGFGWELYSLEGIRMGRLHTFAYGRSADEKLTVEIPPHTRATVNYTISYSRAMRDGWFVVDNRVAQRQVKAEFSCASIFPTSYTYTVSYEDYNE